MWSCHLLHTESHCGGGSQHAICTRGAQHQIGILEIPSPVLAAPAHLVFCMKASDCELVYFGPIVLNLMTYLFDAVTYNKGVTTHCLDMMNFPNVETHSMEVMT